LWEKKQPKKNRWALRAIGVGLAAISHHLAPLVVRNGGGIGISIALLRIYFRPRRLFFLFAEKRKNQRKTDGCFASAPQSVSDAG